MHWTGSILLSQNWTAQNQSTLIQEIEIDRISYVLKFTPEAPPMTVSNDKRLHPVSILVAPE